MAAEQIGIDPSHCEVFEDAFVGIEAAHRGGMKVIAVATAVLQVCSRGENLRR